MIDLNYRNHFLQNSVRHNAACKFRFILPSSDSLHNCRSVLQIGSWIGWYQNPELQIIDVFHLIAGQCGKLVLSLCSHEVELEQIRRPN
jgi:hypothetical protein